MRIKKHFRYDAERDVYVCPAEALLTYSTTDCNGYKYYKSNIAQCQLCEYRQSCAQNKKVKKNIMRHVWEEAKEWSNTLRLSKWGKNLRKVKRDDRSVFQTIDA